jgi:hypothetical protein
MKELHAEIEIAASAERVWQLLTDFPSYPQWNPFEARISGRPRIGERLVVHFEFPGAKGLAETRGSTQWVKVTKAKPHRELRWLGRAPPVPGLLSGEHSHIIEPLEENRLRFIQREVFRGLLVPLFLRRMGTNLQRGYEGMNLALKQRAEASAAERG